MSMLMHQQVLINEMLIDPVGSDGTNGGWNYVTTEGLLMFRGGK